MAGHELKVFVPVEEEEEEEEEEDPERFGNAEDIRSKHSDRCDGREVDTESEWEDDESNPQWSWGAGSDSKRETKREKLLLQTVQEKRYHKVHGKVTAKALMDYGDNPLLLAIKVAEELHSRADKNKLDKDDFIKLASRVEEFTLRFLDPLKYEENERQDFFSNPETDFIVGTALRLKQKKFFDHPVIIDFLTERWYGGYQNRKLSRLWWFLLTVWCLFDIVLFPLIFLLTRVIAHTGIHEKYRTYFKIPYFIFVRDTISYLALLALHLAICLEPSQLSFSGLEWTILCFIVGRLLNEIRQIKDILKQKRDFAEKQRENTRFLFKAAGIGVIKKYIRDRWNIFDLFIIIVFMCAILPLRILTWVESDSITNNRALVMAGYLYGFNTMLLTFRAFGSVLETCQGVGTIQIALTYIVRDGVVVVLHVLLITVAFASTITKVFVAEKSMVKQGSIGTQPACKETGMQCWWKIATHLTWSLLDLSEELTPLKSADYLSETLAHLLYAGYLVLALILLINMLIALLSNTYQRVQDNSRNEWVFQKAITVQTYRNYSPIPVPLNIVPALGEWIYGYCERKAGEGPQSFKPRKPQPKLDVKYLLDRYRLKYGDSFPPTNILEQVLDDVENTEGMVNQVLYKSFTKKQVSNKALLPVGQEAWEAHEAILVDGYLITRQPYVRKFYRCGARYKEPFSSDFPHFEVMILESGETRWLGMGVVFDDYGTDLMPGWEEGTVGYHTDDRKIFDAQNNPIGKKTIGSTAARRGDVIRCTVMFEHKLHVDGETRVPVIFSVNGSRIVPKDGKPSYIEYSMDRPLYPYLAFHYENCVLAKMCAREDIDFQGQELTSHIAEVESELQRKLECVERNLETKLECVQSKLDALLEKLGEGERNK